MKLPQNMTPEWLDAIKGWKALVDDSGEPETPVREYYENGIRVEVYPARRAYGLCD
jgi:hypothetical protein